MNKIKVLIADDSALMRRSLKEILESEGNIEVIASARDGVDVLEKADLYNPDVITLDINMPRMDGITALKKLISKKIAPVIMVSSLTQAGAAITVKALELGAFDYVSKPGGTVSIDMRSVATELIRKVVAASSNDIVKRLSRKSDKSIIKRTVYSRKSSYLKFGYKAVAIGISTGGPKTIFDVLPYLPASLNAAIFLVQHIAASFTETFANRINVSCKMKCVEARAGMDVEPGTIYLGRGGYHMTVVEKANRQVVIRTPKRPDHLFIPSVDVMMDSVVGVYGADTVGVLMTGMGDDGANSMVKIVKSGGFTIAESEESAVVWGMPGEAVARGGARVVLPSWEVANAIIGQC
ncbi:MAG: chemotaxis response regulator protein-glutamate methylesterase [Desulfobacterales bacterium]|nr:chemotaxis response regulator protein-glutamate methylesterase [Desulfobacterales bacterium]